MEDQETRRAFLGRGVTLAAGAGLMGLVGKAGAAAAAAPKRNFKISIAGWSLHNEVFQGRAKQIELFAQGRERLGIEAFELVNTMLEVPTAAYIDKMNAELARLGMVVPLIMVDSEGSFGDPDEAARAKAVRNHEKWIYIAKDLGCHSIRVNWRGEPKGVLEDAAAMDAHIQRSVETYRRICDFAQNQGINVIIENHGGLSSNADALVRLIKATDRPNFGTLPDFGNFADFDHYEGVDKLMPYARGVSAKCKEFTATGESADTDYARMLEIVCDKHRYDGWIGIEYEGKTLGEWEGSAACRDLLKRLRGDQA